jgi:hypothetical protein
MIITLKEKELKEALSNYIRGRFGMESNKIHFERKTTYVAGWDDNKSDQFEFFGVVETVEEDGDEKGD